MRRSLVVMATAGLVAAAAAPVAAAPLTRVADSARPWRPRPATYTVVRQKDVMVRMDDGVELAADVLRPGTAGGKPAPGKFPVIIGQTPYNKNGPVAALTEENDYLIERGYMEVLVDVRGTGSSGGVWHSVDAREQKDFGEVARWARSLPGSNGDIAVYGISYGAITATYTAAEEPPGLKGAFTIVPMGDAYRDVVANGGDIDTGFIPFWLGLVTAAGLVPPEYAGTDPARALETVGAHALGITQFQAPSVANGAAGEDHAYDGPFYWVRSPLRVVDRIQVPTFIVGGEQDLFQRSEPLLYDALRGNGVPTRLLYGPWTHNAGATGEGLPVDGVPTLDVLALRWFDHYVKGMSDPTLDEDIAPVTAWRAGSGSGSGHFQRYPDFPPPDTHYTSLRLGGSPTPGGAAGTLGAAHPAVGQGTLPYLPVAGVCSESLSQWTAGVVPDTAPCASDDQFNDNLGVVYDLPVSGAPLRIAGPSMARLFVSTTATNGSLTVRLEDVSPDGTSTPLTNGWQVLSLRAVDPGKSAYADGLMIRPWHPYTQASELPVESGKVYEVDVEIFPTLAEIAPGHRLRVAIQSADEPHLNTPVPRAPQELGVMTVYADTAHPSSLTLGIEGASSHVLAQHITAAPQHSSPHAAPRTSGQLPRTGTSAALASIAATCLALGLLSRRRLRAVRD